MFQFFVGPDMGAETLYIHLRHIEIDDDKISDLFRMDLICLFLRSTRNDRKFCSGEQIFLLGQVLQYGFIDNYLCHFRVIIIN